MQDKFESVDQVFNNLPGEVQSEIASYLPTSECINLALQSNYKEYRMTLFKPMLDTRKFLAHVMRGEYDAVQNMLKQDINLIWKKESECDYSGRTFEHISAFEYALWALDKHMWTMMLQCIPQTEEGKKVFEKLLAQYNKVNTDGVTYTIHDESITENHFDFENTIIKELQMQVDSINAPGKKNWDAIDNQWREGVGGAQKRLPMHIVDEYCSNEPFYPVPKFTSQPKSSKQFYNWTTKKDEDWFSVDSKLGAEFAIYMAAPHARAGRSGRAAAGVCAWGLRLPSRSPDLEIMKALCEVRTLDLINLKSQLEEQAGLENHYQIVPM